MTEPSQSPEDPATAAERAAKSKKVIAEAERDAAVARVAQLKALIPDLSNVKASTLESKEGSAVFSTFLSFGALDLIADEIKARIVRPLRDARVLVTGSVDLASGDAIFREVDDGLEQLTNAAQSLLASLNAGPGTRSFVLSGVSLLGAVAGAIPGVLSLLSAQRTVATGKTTIDELAAAAAVVSALNMDRHDDKLTLVFDDFRLVPDGRIYAGLRGLNAERRRLIAKKVDFSVEQESAEAALLEAKNNEKRLLTTKPQPDAEKPSKELEEARAAIKQQQQVIDEITVRISLLDAMLTGIDTFTAAVGKIPAGQRRSALAIAALHEQLHSHKGPEAGDRSPQPATSNAHPLPFSHVLLIKTQPGGSQQLNDNKPLWLADKFSTLIEVSVSYVLIKTESSEVVASGTVTRVARAYGKVGERPELDFGDRS